MASCLRRSLFWPLFLLVLSLSACAGPIETYSLQTPASSDARIDFGLADLKARLEAVGLTPSEDSGDFQILIAVDAEAFEAPQEAYRIIRREGQVNITGGDSVGLMYGLLDVAETLRDTGLAGVGDTRARPRTPIRCIKFNLPWDPYCGPGQVGGMNQLKPSDRYNKLALRNLDFWRDYLDEMARNRFNRLSLWAMHPYMYMVRLEEYPAAAYAQGEDMDRWLAFWQELFQLAEDRGIGIYVASWNSVVSPGFVEAHDLKRREYNVSPLVRDYLKTSVRTLVETYPNLAGVITTGSESMPHELRDEPGGVEQFILDTYIAGLEASSRRPDFIYRSWWGGAEPIRKYIMEPPRYSGPLYLDMKFNVSHGLSHPRPHYADDALWTPEPTTYKMVWHVRNEDAYLTRWGDPQFVRDHVNTNMHDWAGGYIVGSERTKPGVDFYSRDKDRMPWVWRYVRNGLYWKLWGRLLYDPTTPDEVFVGYLAERYGLAMAKGQVLLDAYADASQATYALGLWYGLDNDGSIYPEGCIGGFRPNWNPRGHHLEDGPIRQGASRFISISEYVCGPTLDEQYVDAMTFAAAPDADYGDRMTPEAYARELARRSQQALQTAEAMRQWQPTRNALELETLSVDFYIRGHTGLYYAHKLQAGVRTLQFIRSGDEALRAEAIEEARTALEHWNALASAGMTEYGNAPLDLHGDWNWYKYTPDVQRDIAIIETARPATREELQAIDAADSARRKGSLYGDIFESTQPPAVQKPAD